MKRLAILVGFNLLMSASLANAAEASGNVSIGTDYVFRGISQTNENPTIQGGFDIAADSGLYAGIWTSNVAFDGSIEVDLYAGYSGSFTDTVSFDIGFLRYEYPDDAQVVPEESSFNEYYGSVSISDFTIGLNYTSDYFLESDAATYFYLDYSLGLPSDYGLDFHVGSQSIDNNVQFGTPDYNDYSIALSKSAAGLDFSLTWYDTDLSESECFAGTGLCDSRVVFAVGKSL